jgi:HK97 family phage major capsid protein
VTLAGSTSAANLADAIGKIDETVGNTAWVVSRAGWTDFMKIWQAQQTTSVVGGGRVVPTVHGVPIYLAKGIPATTLGVYGDFSMSSAVAMKASGLEIDVARELLIRKRQVLYVGGMRLGIKNHDPQFAARLAKAAS